MPATIYPETPNAPPVTVANPVSGSTVIMSDTQHSLYINNAAVLPVLTIRLPLNMLPGEFVELCFRSSVTTLALVDGMGMAISQSPTNAYGPGAAILMRYVDIPTGWVYWK